ncbi:MAG: PKD domain-containing protein, partial [candidate division WOR-3 bacterium]
MSNNIILKTVLLVCALGLILGLSCKKKPEENTPPNIPQTPSGPSSGQINISYDFSTFATDPDGDSVSYQFDWGDGNQSNWSSFVPSGTSVTMSKSWSNAGTFYVKARAKDKQGAISDWSDTHQITISSGVTFKIAFYSKRNGSSIANLWIINSDGSGLKKLADFNSWSANVWMPPLFSPDGSQIVFIKEYPEECISEIWKVNVDGTGLVQLTDPGRQRYGNEWPFDWSPDGGKISFRSERSNHNGWFEVWTMNADGSNQQNFGESNGTGASFSPDGSKITYGKWYEGHLKVMNADGSNKHTIYQCQEDNDPDAPVWTRTN